MMNTSSFYPGLVQPRFAAITAGAASEPQQASKAITAPAGEDCSADKSDPCFGNGEHEAGHLDGHVARHRTNGARAAKVVGSLDHPILPMPPVSDLKGLVYALEANGAGDS